MISNVQMGDTHTHRPHTPTLPPSQIHTSAPWGERAAYNYAEVDAAVSLGVRVLDRPSLPPGVERTLDLHMNNQVLN